MRPKFQQPSSPFDTVFVNTNPNFLSSSQIINKLSEDLSLNSVQKNTIQEDINNPEETIDNNINNVMNTNNIINNNNFQEIIENAQIYNQVNSSVNIPFGQTFGSNDYYAIFINMSIAART